MIIEHQIKMIDDLIEENREATIKDFADLLRDVEEIETAVMVNKISKVNYSKIGLMVSVLDVDKKGVIKGSPPFPKKVS